MRGRVCRRLNLWEKAEALVELSCGRIGRSEYDHRVVPVSEIQHPRHESPGDSAPTIIRMHVNVPHPPQLGPLPVQSRYSDQPVPVKGAKERLIRRDESVDPVRPLPQKPIKELIFLHAGDCRQGIDPVHAGDSLNPYLWRVHVRRL